MAEIYRSDIVRVDLDHALLRKHVGSILVTGDKLGNRFGAEISRDGKPVDVTGCGVTAYFMRPGEDAIVLNGTASGSVAYVDLAQACYSKASSFTLTIKISYGGSTTALRVIDGYILLTQTDELVDPGEAVPTLDDLLAQIAAMEQGTAAARNVVAEYEGKVADQDASLAALTEENAELREDYVQQAYILKSPHQLWDKFKVNYGGYYKCDGTYVKKDGTCNITVDVEPGKTYNFATPDPTTTDGITAGTANYICPIKEDGSFLYTSADDSALTWKAYYTVPAGIAKIIVSNPVSRLRNGEYSIVEDAFIPSSANPYAPRYASKTEQLMGSKTHISCLGDSLTAGSGGGGTTYPAVLAANSDSIVAYEMGHPSKNAEYIAMMMGAMGMYADPFTIPAAVSPVTITLRDATGTVWDIGKHSPAVEPCRIGGVNGVLDYSDNVLTFTRGRAGEAVTFDRPKRVVTNFELRHMSDICIIWAGTNDTPGSIDSENCTTINIIKNMVEWLPHKKYLVIAPTAKSYHSNVANIQVYFKRAFGNHFVNLRQYLLEYGLADAGITPTEQDASDIANGGIPSSLRSDEVHFNAAGYTVIGNYLYKVIEDFGWLD